ncbi:MAG: DUF6261 family protein [Candidatus Symbiothrix sp.]|jgi:hypothetical protein|nr:DUF6261 family protein [Candidatus Symbiothrix sp.]
MANLISKLDYVQLRNESHVEFHETVNRLFITYPPSELGLATLYEIYKPQFDAEVSVLDLIRKSDYTEDIYEQDHLRDHIFRGLTDAVKSALNHFDEAKKNAAHKINRVIENYGNIAVKTLDQETAAIDDLLREFADGNYPALLQTLSLGDWIDQLGTENERFKTLMMARYGESAQRPTTRMKAARLEVDKAFRAITSQIEALALVHGSAAYEPFVKEINAVIERYKHLLAQKNGRKSIKK